MNHKMSEVKQVKVDNWGIYFLQRLKHFFNRTDYCDLTLQFQDNAQLKVHRLVLSACTEYFELLERTCEMYEDCLVMPDDLQADVVVPIINFMYTGQLEFKMDLLEKLYQTSLVMNMPVLTKLLASHRHPAPQQPRQAPNSYYGKRYLKTIPAGTSSTSSKRSYATAFENTEVLKSKKTALTNKSVGSVKNGNQDQHRQQSSSTSSTKFPVISERNKNYNKDPRPTRYELPEELDEDNLFDNSFTNISYTSKPLMVHPQTTKQYSSKRIKLFEEGSNSSFMRGSTDIVECKKISSNNSLFIDESMDNAADEGNTYHTQTVQVKDNSKGANQLFDQIIDNDSSDITIETKNNKQAANLDHAKIISEVLKKYPHLVKGNKNIKLKILNTGNKVKKPVSSNLTDEKEVKVKTEVPDFTYETDVLDSKEAAKLIALGAENTKGPWICLICGTPGKALHFTSYYNFRKHLVEIHNEKPVPNICEFCGLKSSKRNYLVHHQLTKHNVEPPSHYSFPKCNFCKYVALNEALMVKHKLTHQTFKRSNIINAPYTQNAADYSATIKKTTSKYGLDRKQSLQCIYCLRNFSRENNLYAHLKIHHKNLAKSDGLIDDSEEEIQEEEEDKPKLKHHSGETPNYIKVEVPVQFEGSFDDNNVQYQIERRPDGNIHVVSKKQPVSVPLAKHKILNPGYSVQKQNTSTPISKPQKPKTTYSTTPSKKNEFLQEMCASPPSNSNSEEIVIIDNNEYIVQDYQLIPKKERSVGEYLMTATLNTNKDNSIIPTTSVEYQNVHNTNPETKMFVKKSNTNQPIQIVVSNEEEYKALVSNQSVIFEDNDANKSLTVLTQEGSPIETAAIDLDNTQSNDMMIIQDDYAMNVSEAMAANNPNIVVVYSHPVEDHNKQYQIITTQGVETQFVNSSTIITQNYETISSCAPVMSAPTNIDNSWQNIQASVNKLPIASNPELHTMTVAESVTLAPVIDSSNNVQEYAEVPLQAAVPVPININHIVESQNETIANTENKYLEQNTVPNVTEEINEVPVCQQNTMIAMEQTTVITNIHQQSIPETHIQHMHAANLDAAESAAEHNVIPITTISAIEQPIATTTLTPLAESGEEIQPNNLVAVYGEEIIAQPEPQISCVNNESVIKSVVEENVLNGTSNEIVTAQEDNITQHTAEEQVLEQEPTQTAEEQVSEQEPTQTAEEQVIEQEPCSNVANVPDNAEKLDQEIITSQELNQEIQEDKITEDITENDIPVQNSFLDEKNSDTNVNLEGNTTAKVAIIENLASEWSEDESDAIQENENKTDKPTIEVQDNTEETELEESIENIQQEVEKHVSSEIVDCPKDTALQQESELGEENDLEKSQENTEVISDIQVSSKEKISSLLNDWDDNDSQEDSPAPIKNKTDDQNSTPQNDENVERTTVLVDKSELTKSDNIRSLVSDWDEDDEENKD